MDFIDEYDQHLDGLSEHGKELFVKLHKSILRLDENIVLNLQNAGAGKPHFVYKLKGCTKRFTCIHPTHVPRDLRHDRDRSTSMTMHLNNRTKRLDDKYGLIFGPYTKPNNKSSGYATINIHTEEEIDQAMDLIKQCYALLQREIR